MQTNNYSSTYVSRSNTIPTISTFLIYSYVLPQCRTTILKRTRYSTSGRMSPDLTIWNISTFFRSRQCRVDTRGWIPSHMTMMAQSLPRGSVFTVTNTENWSRWNFACRIADEATASFSSNFNSHLNSSSKIIRYWRHRSSLRKLSPIFWQNVIREEPVSMAIMFKILFVGIAVKLR